jgi:hypothetical protein
VDVEPASTNTGLWQYDGCHLPRANKPRGRAWVEPACREVCLCREKDRSFGAGFSAQPFTSRRRCCSQSARASDRGLTKAHLKVWRALWMKMAVLGL